MYLCFSFSFHLRARSTLHIFYSIPLITGQIWNTAFPFSNIVWKSILETTESTLRRGRAWITQLPSSYYRTPSPPTPFLWVTCIRQPPYYSTLRRPPFLILLRVHLHLISSFLIACEFFSSPLYPSLPSTDIPAGRQPRGKRRGKGRGWGGAIWPLFTCLVPVLSHLVLLCPLVRGSEKGAVGVISRLGSISTGMAFSSDISCVLQVPPRWFWVVWQSWVYRRVW